ncbi:hypothetical protein, partial [Streptococcus pneumoniae]|uniref:hypothetical protein n=1 Tax=Streptococcus pneumoniae TaxID=1313 RepID=UPI001E39082E
SILLGPTNDHLPEYFEPAALVDAYVPNDTHGTLRRIVVRQEIATPAQTYDGTEVVDAVVSERTANHYYSRYANQPPPSTSYMFDPVTYA